MVDVGGVYNYVIMPVVNGGTYTCTTACGMVRCANIGAKHYIIIIHFVAMLGTSYSTKVD